MRDNQGYTVAVASNWSTLILYCSSILHIIILLFKN